MRVETFGSWEVTTLSSDDGDIDARARALMDDGWEFVGPALGTFQVQWEDKVPRHWMWLKRRRDLHPKAGDRIEERGDSSGGTGGASVA